MNIFHISQSSVVRHSYTIHVPSFAIKIENNLERKARNASFNLEQSDPAGLT